MIKLLTIIIPFFTSIVCVFSDAVVKIGETTLIGQNFGPSSKVDFFGGIPFAEPPLGDLRLNFPRISTSFSTRTFDARNFGPGCLQVPAPPSGTSEDCLTLDIYRPAIISEEKHPVLVWIYGGGFVVGSTSFYNGTAIVTRSIDRGTPIIFVSINYRLGPLGFPQGIEAKEHGLLNLGLHDQTTALEWLQSNIHNFGGDRTKVTIFGESAGAASIQIFFLTSKIKGLARAAILESTATLPAFEPDKNEDEWQEYVAAIPACSSFIGTNNTFDCIRGANTSSLEQALVITNTNFANNAFGPVIDGPRGLLPTRQSQIRNRGNLPSILGSNLDEGTIFVPQSTNSTAEIEDALIAMVSPPLISPLDLAADVAEALKLYPDIPSLGAPFGTGNNTFGLNSQYKRSAALNGDLFHSSRRTLSQLLAAAGIPTFAYHFTDSDATTVAEFAPLSPAPGSIGVSHTSEIPYVFGTLINKTPKATVLSAIIQDYWISFVNTLNPNDVFGEQRLKWEQYTSENEVVLNLNGEHTSIMPDNYRASQIGFWQTHSDFLHR